MDINDILSDTNKYPDTLTIKIGEADVPLSSLRAMKAAQTEAAAERDRLHKREKDVEKLQADALAMTQKAQEVYELINRTKPDAAAAAAAAATSQADLLDDPIYAPVKKLLAERDAKIASLEASSKQVLDMMNRTATIWGYERWQKQYDAFPADLRPKDRSLDDLIKYAGENKLVDRFGLPSVEKALDSLSAEARRKQIEDAAFERGRKEAEAAAAAARMPRPGIPGPSPNAKTSPLKDLDQLTDAALADPELRKMMEDMNLNVS